VQAWDNSQKKKKSEASDKFHMLIYSLIFQNEYGFCFQHPMIITCTPILTTKILKYPHLLHNVIVSSFAVPSTAQ